MGRNTFRGRAAGRRRRATPTARCSSAPRQRASSAPDSSARPGRTAEKMRCAKGGAPACPQGGLRGAKRRGGAHAKPPRLTTAPHACARRKTLMASCSRARSPKKRRPSRSSPPTIVRRVVLRAQTKTGLHAHRPRPTEERVPLCQCSREPWHRYHSGWGTVATRGQRLSPLHDSASSCSTKL